MRRKICGIRGELFFQIKADKDFWHDITNNLAPLAIQTQTLFPTNKYYQLSYCLLLSTDEYIKKLNTKYRKIKKATDVLSFPSNDLYKAKNKHLGEIIISIETMEKQAKSYGNTIERESAFLFVHGFLHLLGYDHVTIEKEKVMLPLQEKILLSAGY